MPKRDFSKMTDAELRANAALIKNKKALDAAATAKQNQELLKKINQARRGVGGAGGGGFLENLK